MILRAQLGEACTAFWVGKKRVLGASTRVRSRGCTLSNLETRRRVGFGERQKLEPRVKSCLDTYARNQIHLLFSSSPAAIEAGSSSRGAANHERQLVRLQ